MKLLLATNNAHKVTELKAILGDYFTEIKSLKEAGISFEAVEDGETFEENALKKARQTLSFAYDITDAVLADDSGLCVDILGGAPGVYSARFAGDGHDTSANNLKLVSLLKGVPQEERTARFVSCIALVRKGYPDLCVMGTVDGTILLEARGANGFGYDPYFWYEPLKKSFAEMSAAEKNKVSHRHNALVKLKEALDGENRSIL